MITSPERSVGSLSLATLRERPGAKWKYYPEGVLPCWVAEMDFPLAEPIKRAIHEQVETDDLGYLMPEGLPGLREAVAQRLGERHGLKVEPENVALLGTTGTGINLSVRAFSQPGDEVMLLTPLYPPFKHYVELTGRVPVEVELVNGADGYELDLEAMERAVTPRTRILMLCNPHNPVGRVFTRAELTSLADFAHANDLTVVSDDLHSDLLFDGKHVPIASLDHDIRERTVTLYGPTKAFNLPGLKISFAISEDPKLLERMNEAGGGLATPPNILAQAATIAAYREGDAWLNEVLDYLRGNRDHLLDRIGSSMPRVKVHKPQATYLAWLDLRAYDLGPELAETLVERAGVALNDGATFGAGGEGFVRFNFATSRAILDEALSRLESVLG